MKHRDPFAPGLLAELPEPPRKVVLLRASRIGDFLCAIPAMRALREALPEAEITLITLPMLRELAKRLPYIDKIEEFPGFPGIAEQLFDARRAGEFFRRMQAERFDLAIQMQGTGVYSNPFMLMLGADQTAGFVRPGDGAGLLGAALPMPESGHESERVLALATFLGAKPQGLDIRFTLGAEERQEAENLLQGIETPFIGIHTGARDRTRRWPVERFSEAGATLQRQTGGTLVLLGDEAEQEAAVFLQRQAGVPALDLTGKTGLAVVGAVIDRLSVLLTNDTGPAHIAYALSTPTVTIFGGADLQRYAPKQRGPFKILAYPIDCRPCTDPECPIGYECLQRVGVKQVVEAAKSVIRLENA